MTIAGRSAVAVEHDEILTAAFVRLLRWTDPPPLPSLDDVLFEHRFGMFGLGTLRTLEQRQRVCARAEVKKLCQGLRSWTQVPVCSAFSCKSV
ncbi:hypothetical protein V2S84_27295, partial [Azotobacter chroococcum]|nr:hypothetical protein [Azotobacter chroococcum]